MVGELLYSDDIVSRTSFTIPADNILVEDGSFTDTGIMENIAQTVAAGAGYAAIAAGKPVQIGYIGAVKNFEVFSLPAVGDTLQAEVVFKQQVFNVTIVNGTVSCNNNKVATCEMKIFIGDPGQ